MLERFKCFTCKKKVVRKKCVTRSWQRRKYCSPACSMQGQRKQRNMWVVGVGGLD